MEQRIAAKVLAFSIVILFVGVSLVPLVESALSKKIISADSSNATSIKNNHFEKNAEQTIRPDGPAPQTKRSPTPTTAGKQPTSLGCRGQFYAYDLYSYYTVTFDTDAVLNNLAYAGIYFLSGSDMDPDGNWYAVGFFGGLYSIDNDTGTCNYIADTIPLNGLTYDVTTENWFACNDDSLFYIDITDGATSYIGDFGINNYITILICDVSGNLYGFGGSSGVDNYLFSIDKTTGAAIVIDYFGGYATITGANFDRNDGLLYFAEYDIGGGQSFLAVYDPDTGVTNILAPFTPMDEIRALAIPYGWEPSDDVGVKRIIAPISGDAGIITPEVTVKNYGQFNEYSVPVNMKIVKNHYTDYINEHFNGTFPPAGWNAGTTDYWVQGIENYAGGTAPEAILWYYDNYDGNGTLTSNYVDTSTETGTLLLSFRSYVYVWTSGLMASVQVTPDGGANWYDMNGQGNIWSNPVTVSQGPKQYTVDISAYKGTQTGVRFTYSGSYYWMYYWAVDDVHMFTIDQIPEYNQTVLIDIPLRSSVNVTFPSWTPSDLGVTENANLEYVVNATTQMSYDENTHNDYKQKTFNLNYGYFDDVAVTGIPSPKNGLATTQTPMVNISNNGQNNEDVNVNMLIGKTLVSGTTEDFEATDGGYTHNDFTLYTPSSIWAWGQPTSGPGSAHSGTNCWATNLNRNYPDGMDARLETPNFVCPANGQLSFWQWYEFESFWDGGNVKISTDDGATWTIIYPDGGYPQAATSTADYGIPGEPAYSPTSGGWVKATFDISVYAGQTVKLRFHAGSDGTVNYQGWYIDDVTIAEISSIVEYNQTVNASISSGASMNVTFPDWTPADIPFATETDYLIDASVSMSVSDGNPADNELIKFITLSYEHDVGVTAITEPSGPSGKSDDIIFHQGYYGPDESWAFDTSGMALNYLCYDDFYDLTDSFGSITVTGLSLANNGGWEEASPNLVFDVTFYEDNAGQPGPVIQTITGLVPTSIVDTGLDYIGFSQYVWTIDLGQTISLTSGWMSVQSEIPADNGNLMWATGPDGTLNAYQLQSGTLVALLQNMCFDLINTAPPGHDWPTGTYHVAGIIKNSGVTFPESNISVNAKITHVDNSTVMYDHDTLIPRSLAPGQTALASFPDVTFLNLTSWEGKYKVEIKTMLPGDDHPENDKKTMTFNIEIAEPPIPPNTVHNLTGTMGNNGWYVSDVIITLSQGGSSPPLNVGGGPSGYHTYYKLQNTDNWTECNNTPIWVTVSGTYNLSYYSIDNYNQTEPVKGPFPFKIDMTTPVFINFSVTPENLLKTTWLLNATVDDAPSGIARVDFYVDDAFVATVTSAPWTSFYEGHGSKAQAVVYDNAGNSAMSNEVQVYELSIDAQPAVQTHLLIVQQSILRYLGGGRT